MKTNTLTSPQKPAATARRKRPSAPPMGSRHQPEATRARILDAALAEFAAEGISGARTEAIAKAAGINKALLFYYFGTKEALYRAVLEAVFAEVSQQLKATLELKLPPRERLLAYAGAHFDYLASHPQLPRLMQREMMRSRTLQSELPEFAKRYVRPNFQRLVQLVEEGMASGDFRPAKPIHTVLSMVGCIIFYFISLEMVQPMLPVDPLTPHSLAERRQSVLDFVSAAVFTRVPAPPQGARR